MVSTRAKCARHPRRRAGLVTSMLAVCSSFTAAALAQTNPAATPATAATPPGFAVAFAVASVRPSSPDCPGMSVSPLPGQFSAQCITLLGLMSNAYPVKSQDAVPGMPAWGTTALFDVDAKVDADTAAALDKLPRNEQWKLTKQMIQSLLADRFKLHVHTEARKAQVYVLVAARGGPKLKDAPDSESSAADSWGNGRIQIRKGTVGGLVAVLSDIVGRPVTDRTGLAGKYDIDLTWIPDDQTSTPGPGSSLFTAIEERLGLKLESTKGFIDTFVIDHAERPSGK